MRDVFYFAYCDSDYRGRFDVLRQKFPHAKFVDATHYGRALASVRDRVFVTQQFYVIDDEEEVVVDRLLEGDVNYLNIWQTDNEDKFAGVKALSKQLLQGVDFSERSTRIDALRDLPVAWLDDRASRFKPLPTDIIFLAYGEPNADANLRLLRDRFDARVKVVSGVTGIDKAFMACAEAANTSWFYVVNADSKILPSFDFSFYPVEGERGYQHVWMTRNELIPELVYGYGGIKLFHKRFFTGAKFNQLDFTTHLVAQKYHDEVASVMQVADERQAFRAAFRESAKLQAQGDPESLNRLNRWLSVDRGTKLKAATLAGATLGSKLVATSKNLSDVHAVINHFPAIDAYFEQARLWWQDVKA